MQPVFAPSRRNAFLFFVLLFACLLAARLCHLDILWADEDYHQAAAIQILHGKMLYRDLWYDKPPLSALVYLLFAAQGGWILRSASALFATLVSLLAFRFASRLWTNREGYWAAGLSAFFLIFYFPGATITLEPDTLMMAPHLIAICLAWRGRALLSGVAAGIAMLFNVKGIFVLAACSVFVWRSLPVLAVGFLLPNLIFFGGLLIAGSFRDYFEQVWRWGFLYSASPDTVRAGLVRALNWFGFHSALMIGAVCLFVRYGKAGGKWGAWFVLSLIGAGIGWRFLPRYMDQLLPPLVILGARGLSTLWDRRRWVAGLATGLALMLPIARFGPRYVILASELRAHKPHEWADVALDLDSRAAARTILRLAHPGDTIMVWGYRPNVIAYTRLPVAGKFWDSQPLTGVPADRHLYSTRSIAEDWVRKNREELIRTKPSFISDGLSLLNPELDMSRFPDLREWLESYCAVTRTSETVIYRRCKP
jgi:hypothetical protein